MNRRWFLKALIALPLVPLATKVAAAIELGPAEQARLAKRFPSTSDIIAATIESRSASIADNVSKNNSLLAFLREHDAGVEHMTEEQSEASRRRSARWHLERRLKSFRRGRNSGYSEWAAS